HSRFTARCSAAGSNRSAGTSKLTTCPQACTPASVRPAQVMSTGLRTTVSRASRSAPPTVRTPGFGAKPWKPPPSYATVIRTRTSGPSGAAGPASSSGITSGRERPASDELDPGHGRVVALARAQLEDARVAAVAVDVARGDLGDELVAHLLVAEERVHLADVVQGDRRVGVRLARLGDQLLRDRA